MPDPLPAKPSKKVPAFFYKSETGNEPVREWLRGLTQEDRKAIGEDIQTAEWGWPIGMPVCRPLGKGLHEVRTKLGNRIARVIFYVDQLQRMVLLHGFIKKTEQTPDEDMALALKRKTKHKEGVK